MTTPRVTTRQAKTVQEWLDTELSRDADFRRKVEERLNQLRIEQDLAGLRERRNVSQRQLARILGVSQPAVAKIESGAVKNLEIKTLVRYAVALGGRVRIEIKEDERTRPTAAAQRARRRGLTDGRATTRKVAQAS